MLFVRLWHFCIYFTLTLRALTTGHRPHWPNPLSTLHKRRSKRFHRPAFLVLCCHMSRLAFNDFISASWADLRCQVIIKMSLYLSLLSSHGLVLCWSHARADGGVLHCANVSPWLWFLWIWPFDVLWIGKDVSLGKIYNVECFIVVKLIIFQSWGYLHTFSLYPQHVPWCVTLLILDTGVRKLSLGLFGYISW